MKSIIKHVERIQAQPHHVRKQVALSVAVAGTAFVGLVWFVGSAAAGVFAIQGSNFAAGVEQGAAIATTSAAAAPGLAGAAAALQESSAPAHIEIVDTTPAPAAAGKQPEQTTITF